MAQLPKKLLEIPGVPQAERIYADLRRRKRGDFPQRWQPIFARHQEF